MLSLYRLRAVFTITFKRLWAQRGLTLLTLIGLVTAVALVMTIPLYADAVYFRILQEELSVNAEQSRIEMHLEARVDLVVRWPGAARSFSRGERIHTESSYKYRVDDFVGLLRCAGLPHAQVWTDEKGWFAVVLARP